MIDPGPWIEAFIILGYYTVLYGSNRIFRIAQRTAIAASLAYLFCQAWDRLIVMGYQQISVNPTIIIAIILGILSFFTFSETYGWIARYPTAFLMGIGFGLFGAPTIMVDLIKQVEGTLVALATPDIIGKINGLVVLVGLVFVMIYFIYTLKQTRPVRWTMKIARYFLMAALGAGAADFTVGCLSWAIEPISRVVYHWFQPLISTLFQWLVG